MNIAVCEFATQKSINKLSQNVRKWAKIAKQAIPTQQKQKNNTNRALKQHKNKKKKKKRTQQAQKRQHIQETTRRNMAKIVGAIPSCMKQPRHTPQGK